MMKMRTLFILASLSSVLLWPAVVLSEQKTWVVTIAADNYEHLGEKYRLQYCANDATQILERLRNRNRVAVEERILCMRSDAIDPTCTPTHANITQKFPEFIGRADAGDVVIVFAAVHGVRLRDPQTGAMGGYLLPTDADPNKTPGSLISLEWLRSQLLNSPAQTIVLFLDACHSGAVGTEVTTRLQGLSTRDVAHVFHEAPVDPSAKRKTFYTLVSCSEEESALEWSTFQQGIFAYWLCQGLDGAADVDGDAFVSMDELFRFVRQEVPRTAAFRSWQLNVPLKQHPQRFLLGSSHEDLKLFPLHAQSAGKTLDRLVDLVDAVTKNHVRSIAVDGQIPRISVLEFRSNIGGERELRGPLGSLGAIARDIVERGLLDRSSDPGEDAVAYRVVSEESLRPGLRGVDFEGVLSGKLRPSGQDQSSNQVDAVVLGTFSRRGHQPGDPAPDRLRFEVQVFDVHQTAPVGRIGITMLVDGELWSLLGGSRDERTAPAPALVVRPVSQTELCLPAVAPDASNATWNQQAQQSHPLRLDENAAPSTLRVTMHRGRPGQPKFASPWLPPDPKNPNLLSFPVCQGDEIEACIANQTDQWLAVVVLVDGQNVIGRQRTLPCDARYWLWPPRAESVIGHWLDGDTKIMAEPAGKSRQHIEGRRLLVTDPPSSVAGQQGFTDQLGEIRLLVYGTVDVPPDAISRGATDDKALGIGEGDQSTNVFPLYRHKKIDLSRPLATYVIHYLETDRVAIRP